jgi:tRNA (Thr-GGU) A37 N-methylase
MPSIGTSSDNLDRAVLHPIGVVRSQLKDREKAPNQGNEGAPDAFIEFMPEVAEALEGIDLGDKLIVITWFTSRAATS